MIKKILSCQTEIFQKKITFFANHLLVLSAFFSPIYRNSTVTMFILLSIIFLIRGNYSYYLKKAFSNKIAQAFVLLYLLHLVWMIGADNLEIALDTLKNRRYLLFPILILLFLDKRFSTRIIMAFIAGMLFSEAISYMIHFSILPYHLELFGKTLYKAQDLNNPTPFLVHYDYNTLLSIVVGVLIYNFFMNKNSLIVKIVSIFFISTASINLILIGGRTGYIVYIAVVILTFFMIFKDRFFIKALPIAALLLSAFFYLAYSNGGLFKDRIDAAINDFAKMQLEKKDLNTSIGHRLILWNASKEAIKDNFLFGVGTGDAIDTIRKNIPEKYKYAKIHSQPHNEYLKYFVQFGLIGFIIFLNLFYQVHKVKVDSIAKKAYLNIINISFLIVIFTNELERDLLLIMVMLTLGLSTNNNYLKDVDVSINNKIKILYILFFIMLVAIGKSSRI